MSFRDRETKTIQRYLIGTPLILRPADDYCNQLVSEKQKEAP